MSERGGGGDTRKELCKFNVCKVNGIVCFISRSVCNVWTNWHKRYARNSRAVHFTLAQFHCRKVSQWTNEQMILFSRVQRQHDIPIVLTTFNFIYILCCRRISDPALRFGMKFVRISCLFSFGCVSEWWQLNRISLNYTSVKCDCRKLGIVTFFYLASFRKEFVHVYSV